uniref:Phosphoinositide phospholipase C n=1 Tax=Alexandrium monilatum TaxID=311494 RepID=A0A7S4SA51_9DINO
MDGRAETGLTDPVALDGAEAPEEEDVEFYNQLERRGWKCGVHDPDFAVPLDGTLHLERGLRYLLRLDCEDESLSFEARRLAEIRTERRDGVGGGYGVALIDTGGANGAAHGAGQSVLCVVVAGSEEERGLLVRVIERLRDDPRSFRRVQRRALLGCLPAGCAPGALLPSCVRPGPRAGSRRRPQSAPAAGESPPASAAAPGASAAGPPHPPPLGMPPRGRSASAASGSRLAAKAAAPSPEWAPALEDARGYVRKLWERELRMASTRRSGSFRDLAMATMRRAGPSRSSEQLDAPARAQAATAATSVAAPQPKASDRLDAAVCAGLLSQLLCNEDTARLSSLAELFSSCGGDATVSFADFWDVFAHLTLVHRLLAEAGLQKYLEDDDGIAGMSLEKWRWFLVQVQDEERAVVEAAAEQLSRMCAPDVNGDGRMSLVGLSKHLCSPGNSILRPQRCEVHQDMARPLAEYWIASAHHVHADPPGAAPSAAASEDGDRCRPDGAGGALRALSATLESACRCLNFALASDGEGEKLSVLLQQQRVGLLEVLRLIDERAFQRTEFPLLLVLWLGLLPLAGCAAVPGALSAAVGPRLWRGEGPGLPSPEEARGRIVVVLAPFAAGVDPPPDAGPPPALGGEAAGAAPAADAGGAAERERAEAIQAWRDAGGEFAVWPGQDSGTQLVQVKDRGIRVSFVACDELQMLEEPGRQALAEFSREHLSLVYPLAPRCAPSNFNAAGAWAAGVQMAALTFHAGGGDAASLAHAGRFRQENGGCGYVLKPPHLRRASGGQGSEAAQPAPVRLELRFLAARAADGAGGQGRPSGPVAVAASVWGGPGDCARRAYRPTRPTGAVVAWPEAAPAGDGAPARPLGFPVTSPSTAVLVVEVLELDAREGGMRRTGFFAAPVDGLRQGFRWVPLWRQGWAGEVHSTHHGPLAGLLAHVRLRRM